MTCFDFFFECGLNVSVVFHFSTFSLQGHDNGSPLQPSHGALMLQKLCVPGPEPEYKVLVLQRIDSAVEESV